MPLPEHATARPIVVRPDKTLIMGILNITPDSFYDGGRWNAPEQAVAHARSLVSDGADILDLGAESSRPGSNPVSPEEEQARLLPVLDAVLDAVDIPISIDTWRADTAQHALERGASMINDISGLRMDPEMPGVVAAWDCPCVVMHMQGQPKTMQQNPVYEDVVEDICRYFEARLEDLQAQGVRRERIWLDPGFGFGKTVEHNLEIMRRLGEFKRLGQPLMLGSSNKATIGAVLNEAPPSERMEGTAATVALGIAQGVDAVRVHDVKAMARVAAMSDAILRGRT